MLLRLDQALFSRRQALLLLAASAFAGMARADDGWRPPAPDRELMVPVRGGRIYVRVNGPLDGPRAPVIMAHGGPGGSLPANLRLTRLARERAVILYDQLDCGKSDVPNDPDNWSVERFTSEVDAIRAALNLKRLHFHGHSWGATIALEYAARRPAGLRSVILQGPLVSTRRWIADADALRATLPRAVQAALDAGERTGDRDTEAYRKAEGAFYAEFNMRRRPEPWMVELYRAYPNRFNSKLYRTMWGPSEFVSDGFLKDYDGEHLLKQMAAPSLFLCGQYDEARPATCRAFARQTRGSEVKVIADASHGIQNDQPEAWLAAVKGWLDRHD